MSKKSCHAKFALHACASEGNFPRLSGPLSGPELQCFLVFTWTLNMPHSCHSAGPASPLVSHSSKDSRWLGPRPSILWQTQSYLIQYCWLNKICKCQYFCLKIFKRIPLVRTSTTYNRKPILFDGQFWLRQWYFSLQFIKRPPAGTKMANGVRIR